MSIFDFFVKENEPKETEKNNATIGNPINMRTVNGGALQVFKPKKFDDFRVIIDALKHNQSAIVYFDELKRDDPQRCLDVLSGAIYALDGSVMPIENNVYIFTLDGVTVRK